MIERALPSGRDVPALIERIERADPGFAARVRGASREEVDALEVLVGHPLPALYRDFLERLGHELGGYTLGAPGGFTLADVRRWYLRHEGDAERLPPDTLLLGVQVQIECSLVLALDREDPASAGGVLMIEGPEVVAPIAERFETLLFRRAFLDFELRRRPCYGYWQAWPADPGCLAQIEAVMRAADFGREWFSEPGFACFSGPRASLALGWEAAEGRPFVGIQLRTDALDELRRLGAALSRVDSLELDPYRTSGEIGG